MKSSTFYPEMNQEAPEGFDLQAEMLYKRYKVTPLKDQVLNVNRSLTLEGVDKAGRPYYYATRAALDKLQKTNSVTFKTLLD